MIINCSKKMQSKVIQDQDKIIQNMVNQINKLKKDKKFYMKLDRTGDYRRGYGRQLIIGLWNYGVKTKYAETHSFEFFNYEQSISFLMGLREGISEGGRTK